ncbi:hypothetical protein GCM10009651_29570 [Microbacterium natoriense]|uniref:AAA family ATPase n=1 Tax=Microbacterium natoriense TaxID=284570 RepID=UPI0031DA74BA
MLWEIRDFKGIESAQLDIRPGKATILTGINSSGKSSTIQSLLLVAQSLYNEGPVVLNGPLVRLGDAEDLVREGSSTGDIRIRLGIDPERPDGSKSEVDLTAEYELVATDDRSSLRARRLTFTSSRSPLLPLELAWENSRKADRELAMHATRHLGNRSVLHLKSMLGSDGRQLRTYAVLQGLRPVGIVELLDPKRIARLYSRAFRSLVADAQDDEESAKRRGMTRKAITPSIVREFILLIENGAAEETELEPIVQAFSQVRGGNPYAFELGWRSLSQGDRDRAIERAAEQRALRSFAYLPLNGTPWRYSVMGGGLLESLLESGLGKTFDALGALSASLDELARRVQYLGPLRDEPRVVWNHWNELARGLPVGTRGEFSAAVLSQAATRAVHYRTPKGAPVVDRLSTAVNQWLEHLEIGDSVTARARGKLGVGFDLKMDGKIRDLTSVGVGVSQTLPLLVGLLSAPHDSVFIVEQPELHLHPAVQARLADFMLSARPDVALVIETHSEAFITRIRRRAAEDSIDVEDVDITFVEPSRGGSRTRKLVLSEFGDLNDWPDGFLSSSEDDVRAILQMNVKRARGTN